MSNDSYAILAVNSISAIIATLLTLAGISHTAIAALIVLMSLDFVFGISRAIHAGEQFSSKKLFKGLHSKVATLGLLMAIAILLREAFPAVDDGFITPTFFSSWLLIFFTTNEVCSIGDNIREIKDMTTKKYSSFHIVSVICSFFKVIIHKWLPDATDRDCGTCNINREKNDRVSK